MKYTMKRTAAGSWMVFSPEGIPYRFFHFYHAALDFVNCLNALNNLE